MVVSGTGRRQSIFKHLPQCQKGTVAHLRESQTAPAQTQNPGRTSAAPFDSSQERLRDHIGPCSGTYEMGYKAVQPLLVILIMKIHQNWRTCWSPSHSSPPAVRAYRCHSGSACVRAADGRLRLRRWTAFPVTKKNQNGWPGSHDDHSTSFSWAWRRILGCIHFW